MLTRTSVTTLRTLSSRSLCSCYLRQANFSQKPKVDEPIKTWRDLEDGKETGVTVVAFNRPESMNALTESLGKAFGQAFAEVAATVSSVNNSSEIGTRAVVLTGMGNAFSAGGDMGFLKDRSEDNPHHNALVMRAFYRSFLDPLRTLPVPVISAINGPAIGAGLCVALATDIRIASTKAKLGVTFTRLGIHPGMAATHYLPLLVGNQIAARLLLTGDVVDGEEAKRLGLVLDAVEPEKVLPEALSLARRIAQQSAVSVQTCVRTLRNKLDKDLESSLWREADAQAQCYAGPDIKEGIASIKEKRAPVFIK